MRSWRPHIKIDALGRHVKRGVLGSPAVVPAPDPVLVHALGRLRLDGGARSWTAVASVCGRPGPREELLDRRGSTGGAYGLDAGSAQAELEARGLEVGGAGGAHAIWMRLRGFERRRVATAMARVRERLLGHLDVEHTSLWGTRGSVCPIAQAPRFLLEGRRRRRVLTR